MPANAAPTPPAAAAARAELVGEVERLFHQLAWRGRRHVARRAATFGLTVPQYLVLASIGKLGPRVTMGEIGETLQLPASSMTSVADRLVRDGLVERGTHPTDRRAVVATLTPAGVELVGLVEARRHADLAAVLDGLPDGDLADFSRLLAWILDGVDRVLEEPLPATDGDQPNLVAVAPPRG